MKLLRPLLLAAGFAAIAGCVPRSAPPPPPPQPQPQARPTRPVPPPPPPPAADWRDIPLTRGGWTYSGQEATTQALFGAPNSEAIFLVRCDRARRQITLSREGTTTGNRMTLRTSYAARNLPVTVQREPMAYVSATMAPTDPFLDGIAFSRGRFTVEVPGLPMLVIPAWAEPARVVEDCRG